MKVLSGIALKKLLDMAEVAVYCSRCANGSHCDCDVSVFLKELCAFDYNEDECLVVPGKYELASVHEKFGPDVPEIDRNSAVVFLTERSS